MQINKSNCVPYTCHTLVAGEGRTHNTHTHTRPAIHTRTQRQCSCAYSSIVKCLRFHINTDISLSPISVTRRILQLLLRREKKIPPCPTEQMSCSPRCTADVNHFADFVNRCGKRLADGVGPRDRSLAVPRNRFPPITSTSPVDISLVSSVNVPSSTSGI